jgi:peptidoglycan/LPS O-acetylase OafA/YrhL
MAADHETLRGASRTVTPTPRNPGFRADIEGLRALAVLVVLAYHAKLGPFTGGLVGVDVFFVLSGFLITSLLLRELGTTGRISLPDFWARRARRLLPASALVIVATLVASRWMLTPLLRRSLGHDALAACLFVVNIVFGRRNSDYLGAQLSQAAPSPLLHYWSLALEEQFYVVWPVLLLLVSRAKNRMRAISVTVGGLFVVSFVACLWYTKHSPVWAFYLLPTRAWELLAGAALAVVGTRTLRFPADMRASLGWCGVLGLIVSVLSISDHTVFPGWAALLPVASTVLIVGAGGEATRQGPVLLLRWRPLQWVGQRSYAIYLWHWPVYILAEAKWGPLSATQRAGAMTLSIGLAALSYTFVETPVRHARWLTAQARRSLAVGAALVGAGAAVSVLTFSASLQLSGGGAVAAPSLTDPPTSAPASTSASPSSDAAGATDSSPSTEAPASSAPPTTSGARTLAELVSKNSAIVEQSIAASAVPSNLTPGLNDARVDLPSIYHDGCLLDPGIIHAKTCIYGNPTGTIKVALVGDSHAAQWFPALDAAAKSEGWQLLVLVKKGCSAADFKTFDEASRPRTDCAPWKQDVVSRLTDYRPDIVFASSFRYRLAFRPLVPSSEGFWKTSVSTGMRLFRPLTKHLVWLSDTPHPVGVAISCLSGHVRNASACLLDRADADRAPMVRAEQAAAAENDAVFVHTDDWFCNPTKCVVMMGNVMTYRDDNHITATMSNYFAPFLAAVGRQTLAG